MTDKNEALSQARDWFNDLDTNIRNQMVLTMYKLCMGINSAKVAESINSQWNEKFKKQEEINRQLKEDSKIFSKLEELEKEISILNTKKKAGTKEILSSMPDSHIKEYENNCFIFATSGYNVLINNEEQKPENFKLCVQTAKENNRIQFAILIVENANKTIEMETIYTKSGSVIIIYITNTLLHPERILYALDAGILL